MTNRINLIRLWYMNDTIKKILSHCALNSNKNFKSSDFLEAIDTDMSQVTIKRALTKLSEEGVLQRIGGGRSTSYQITSYGRLNAPIEAKEYFELPEEQRNGRSSFDFNFFENIESLNFFNKEEIDVFSEKTKQYREKVSQLSDTLHKKELERFVIELSWKSSSIEGNTYTLLDTEKLIKDGIPAIGHPKEEAIMILNHKKAFDYVLSLQKSGVLHITPAQVHKLHAILVDGLGISKDLRKGAVGITGSSYLPISIPQVIENQFGALVDSINKKRDPYSRALLTLAGISYLQPYDDGNKRTARLLANAYLVLGHCAPLSYRNVNEADYRNALLVFYEHCSIFAFKKIFTEQYDFSCKYYNVG